MQQLHLSVLLSSSSLYSALWFLFISAILAGKSPYSQLQDEDHICLVLVDVVQLDDVGVQDLLQNGDLTLDLLPAHPAPASPALALLDELGSIFHPCAFLSTLLHYSKLATERTRRQQKCS